MSRAAALPPDLAARPAGEALRWIALFEVARARDGRTALAAGEDAEALHDFRVAMRRLRSLLRAWRDELGDAVRPSTRRRLRRLAAATNPGRDAEVGLGIVQGWLAGSAGAERRALAALAGELERRRDAAYEEVRREVLADFDRAAGDLERGLRRYEIRLGDDADAPPGGLYGDLLAKRLAAQGEELLAALAAAGGEAAEQLHAARIAAKRLRYLAEPVLGEMAAARPLVERLKELQDALGASCDLAVLGERLAAAAARGERQRLRAVAGGPPARPVAGGRSGRLAVARRIAVERAALLAGIGRDWRVPGGAKVGALETALAGLLGALDGRVTPAARSAPGPAA